MDYIVGIVVRCPVVVVVSPAMKHEAFKLCNHGAVLKVNQVNFNFNLVRDLSSTRKPSHFFKLDITKAFDSVSWEYLLELMQQMGFGHR
ncbi:hypothetical protein E2562_034182 [Oryza meyeriana var. granulata]|uniref:Reverse transcriptase domain-containing protein n=1 Tax=Oryza meyeriana var. granulata TaxID=110450 RepID=A0A6G1F151_9ORYZ|nr:hypothetical protein E2562_034182 [Oryza meyeriana var. granulata]